MVLGLAAGRAGSRDTRSPACYVSAISVKEAPVPASVKDVAAAAGVSLGTVSNVLNRPDRVSAGTRSRVERAMADLGFVRNESARQLRMGRSSTMAYVMLDAGNPFFTDVASGMEQVAEQADMSLVLCNSANSAARELGYLHRLEQQRVQGIFITPVDPEHPSLEELPRRGTPIVIVDRVRREETHCSVAVDDVLGGQLAAGHLVERGHRRIAFVGGPDSLGQVRDRLLGARRAWSEADLDPAALRVVGTDDLSVAAGRQAAERIAGMSARERPTAAMCVNDLVALGLLQQCVAMGVRVPEELALVGYDDIEFAASAGVPITSMRQPRERMGAIAVDLLLAEIDGAPERSRIVLQPELVVRESSASR
jgi:LacI family transcriptional regulator